jgi:hypothetical protein
MSLFENVGLKNVGLLSQGRKLAPNSKLKICQTWMDYNFGLFIFKIHTSLTDFQFRI